MFKISDEMFIFWYIIYLYAGGYIVSLKQLIIYRVKVGGEEFLHMFAIDRIEVGF